MNHIVKKLRYLGKVEDYEIQNNSLVIFLIGPSLFIYSYFINNFGNDLVRIEGAREFFAVLFLLVSILPLILKKTIHKYYGWIIFLLMLVFSHYLVINLYINDFKLPFLLGFYSIVFGAILVFNNRPFINIFMVTVFIHLLQKLIISEIDDTTYNAILSSFFLLFIFTIIILNGSTSFKNVISKQNRVLEQKVNERTFSLQQRAKDLVEKNKDLEEFAYVVSHDLKTPLRNIMALSSWLDSAIKENDTAVIDENLSLIQKQTIQMELIIEGVLNYSLQNEVSSKKEEVDLDKLICDLARLNRSETCSIEIKKKLPIIKINKTQILQVFQNLIQNAIKYNDKDVCKIEIDFVKKNKFYTFSIRDNSVGIDQRYHKKIFLLFQKLEVEKSVDSLGLGLALVKKIITRNNGEIYLKSKVNRGTTFYFTLPV